MEVRVAGTMRTPADVDTWFDGVRAALAHLPPGKRQVVAADWRDCSLMSDEAAARALLHLKQASFNMERSAALATTASPMAVLQFLRLCRSSDPNGNRRLFTEPSEMSRWLEEVLTGAECHRLRMFLAERPVTPAAGTL